jgi:phage/plasmid primase-like uncharacterized protein
MIDFNQWRGDAPRAEIDYPTLARLAIPHAREILEKWMPGGKVAGREYLCATIKGGAGTSCSTNINTGVGGDFATDVAWGDLIAFVSKADAIPPHEAAGKIAKFIGADLTKPLPPLPPITTASPEEKYEAGREAARRMLDEGVPCPADFAYLARKGVKPAAGVKFHQPTENMLVPLFDEKGELRSVQRISADGTKKINDGGKLSGNMFVFQGNPERVYLGEGYATTATVHELTGSTSVMGITSGNLPAVAEALARMYPAALLIVAGDADDAGRKAAAKVREKVPRFKAVFPPKEGDDWNDLYAREGAEAVRAAIDAAMETAPEKTGPEPPYYETLNPISLSDLILSDLPDPEPLIEGILYPETVLVIGALVKTHKTWVALQLALSGVCATDFLGHAIRRKIRVLYIGGEGSDRTIKKRGMTAMGYIPGLQDGDCDNLGVVSSQGQVKLDTPEGEKWLQRVSEGYDVVIIDPYYRFLSVGSENDHADQRAIQDVFDRLKAKGKAIVIVHHLRKPQRDVNAGAAELRGAGLDAFADTILLLSRKKGEEKRFNLKYILRHDEEPDDLELSLNGPLLQVATPLPSKVTTGDFVFSIGMEKGGEVSATSLKAAVKELTGASKHEIDNALAEALKEKAIGFRKREGRGRGRVFYVPTGGNDA